MNITHDETTEVRYYRRYIDIEGAEPILLDRNYSHGGKAFQPDRAGTRWDHGERIKAITLGGFVLKADGTPGKSRTTVDYITPANKAWGTQWGTAAPAWLLELFGIEVPGTDSTPAPSTYSI